MSFKWSKNVDPTPLLKSFYSRVEIVDRAVHIVDIRAYADAALISSMLGGSHPDGEPSTKNELVWEALISSAGDHTKERLLAELNLATVARKKRGTKNFVLVTTLSAKASTLPEQMTIVELSAQFSSTLPENYCLERDRIAAEQLRFGSIKADNEDYCYVRIEVDANDVAEAFTKASWELDILRGMICLLSNPGFEKSLIGTEHKPINVTRKGSFHTMHDPDGNAASEIIWYEPNYERRTVTAWKEPDKLMSVTQSALETLRARPYKGRLALAIVRFARAFDEVDPDTAFVKGWSAFESILSDSQADYPQLIKRCVFLFQDREYHAAAIKQLAEHRNASVHRVSDASLSRTFCYLLQNYFSKALSFHLFHYHHFDNFQEALSFLSGPYTRSDLYKSAARAELAKKFLKIDFKNDAEEVHDE
ncbi:hypothetical protein CEE60_02640 [Stenotrophomonas maltophilia]|uniref:Uncharacterized protein n=1 Tax=Stenotrophomonas maltophilia TaxID=40324 RepID=A0A246HSC9_STEMA|nr:hypothetical protein [Stenotrophomonas maltophilia]OWQ56390.1 hypothetical protein CEE60_02640 [Stenotrophomonas maltophilia]